MTTQQINSRLVSILSEIGLGTTSINQATHFSRDLGLDSLDMAELILNVERQFTIRVPDEDWERLQTWGQLNDYLVGELTDGYHPVTAVVAAKSENV